MKHIYECDINNEEVLSNYEQICNGEDLRAQSIPQFFFIYELPVKTILM